ncbi:MAG: methionyl-tRNA formyltransferase [Deltaproteobacteria bacterium]|nr:methionyl-tRNA formyltransferase [Deltaproteobacteria bacterium]
MAGLIFFGSPDFAVPCLQALVQAGENILAVVTQPDRPAGRGRKLKPPPVKTFALEKKIRVIQPERVRIPGFIEEVRAFSADLFVVVAFGQILTEKLLNVPRLGCINVHASLLPKLRGAAPIQWAILEGMETTGLTIQKMVRKLDAGDILVQEKIPIGPDETAGKLHDRLAMLGAKILPDALKRIRSGSITPIPQDHTKATFARMLNKKDGLIEWSRSAQQLHNLVRGLNPRPSAFTFVQGKRLIIHKTALIETGNSIAEPGTILSTGPDGIIVATGRGLISLVELQPGGGKKMNFKTFLAGREIRAGQFFGDSV